MQNRPGFLLRLKRYQPLLASIGGAMVMLLAFFIPSVQDQWDRHQARRVVNQYLELGDDLSQEGKYKMATEAYARAFELSEEKRLDIEIKRLNAKVNMVYNDPEWGDKMPDDLREVDFQYLLHIQKGPEDRAKRTNTLICYGIFLAHSGKLPQAEKILRDVLNENPDKVLGWVNLGNLLDQEKNQKGAEEAYRKAIRLEPGNVIAHYNLGLLLYEQTKRTEALHEFELAKKLDPQDSAIEHHYQLARAR